MMQLRAQYLGDEPVKARLKSLVRQIDPTHAPGLPMLSPVSSYTHLSGMAPMDSNGLKNKKKQKRRSKNANSNNNNNNNGAKGNNNGNGQGGKKNNQTNIAFTSQRT